MSVSLSFYSCLFLCLNSRQFCFHLNISVVRLFPLFLSVSLGVSINLCPSVHMNLPPRLLYLSSFQSVSVGLLAKVSDSPFIYLTLFISLQLCYLLVVGCFCLIVFCPSVLLSISSTYLLPPSLLLSSFLLLSHADIRGVTKITRGINYTKTHRFLGADAAPDYQRLEDRRRRRKEAADWESIPSGEGNG